ncbi:hypothetical protein A3715_17215 [Oleiphilus sp. HI0009]|nr:hypothetical protein A3715_17215 [Oleiphilus sp. HI0009]
MPSNHSFIYRSVTLKSSYCKNALKENLKRLDENSAYICKTAPLANKTVQSAANEAVIELEKLVNDLISHTDKTKEQMVHIVSSKGYDISTYHEEVTSDAKVEIRTHISNMYIELLVAIDSLLPYIETMYLFGEMTLAQRNKLVRAIKSNMTKVPKKAEEINKDLHKMYRSNTSSKSVNRKINKPAHPSVRVSDVTVDL